MVKKLVSQCFRIPHKHFTSFIPLLHSTSPTHPPTSLPLPSLSLSLQVGATIQQGLGSLPLPSLPPRVATWLSYLLDSEGEPPATLSGATLAVQREQQMDQLEQMMASIQHNRLRVALQRHAQQRPPPSPEQVLSYDSHVMLCLDHVMPV